MNYKNIYNNLISRAKISEDSRKKLHISGVYFEKHHITPRCLGGNNLIDNISYLTPEEHFLAHLLLIKIYPNEYNMYLSIQIMIGKGKYKKNNKSYGNIRRLIKAQKKIIGMPEKTRRKISDAKTGVKFSEEHKHALSLAKKGKSWEELFGVDRAKSLKLERSQPRGAMSEETKSNISNAKRGIAPHIWTEEMKLKTSATMTGVKKSDIHCQKLKEYNSIEKICPYCNKSGSGPAMQRWHFNNCKNNVKI